MAAARQPSTILSALTLIGVAASTYYTRQQLKINYEENEARLDEIEGTLRGHIGLIENSLERIEKKIGSENIKNKGGIGSKSGGYDPK